MRSDGNGIMRKLLILATVWGMGLGVIDLSGETLTVKGSDTLVNVVQVLAENYRSQTGERVSVGGGGSGAGIKAIMQKSSQGGCHIASSSRKIKEKEVERAEKMGVKLTEVVIARDGLCVIVNTSNPISQMTYQQIQAVYQGQIKKWNKIEKNNWFSKKRRNQITILGRQPSSGTYVYFRDEVVQGDYSFSMLQLAGNAQILETVSRDESAIGYVGVGYLRKAPKNIKAIKLSRDGEFFYHPVEDEKDYPLVRPLFQYITTAQNKTMREKIRGFIGFILSKPGQLIVEKEGFLNIGPVYQRQNQERLSYELK